jgi:Translocase of chloroplast 159/132, membrane anchor domain
LAVAIHLCRKRPFASAVHVLLIEYLGGGLPACHPNGILHAADFVALFFCQVSGRANLNSKNTGQVSVRITSHDKQELAYAFVAPVLGVLWRKLRNRGRGEFDL